MKVTTAPQVVSTPDSNSSAGTRINFFEAPGDRRRNLPDPTAEERLTTRIFQDGSGKKLIKFCRELSTMLIRHYDAERDTGEFREKLCASLAATLKCSGAQSRSLVDLSLELIHARLHGGYSRSEVELGFLIATATGAVSDVSSN